MLGLRHTKGRALVSTVSARDMARRKWVALFSLVLGLFVHLRLLRHEKVTGIERPRYPFYLLCVRVERGIPNMQQACFMLIFAKLSIVYLLRKIVDTLEAEEGDISVKKQKLVLVITTILTHVG